VTTIHLLWPTVRPEAMKAAYRHWMEAAIRKDWIRLKLAVNSESDRAHLAEFPDVLVLGAKRRGAAFATYSLFKEVAGEPGDVVVFAADDIFAPPSWDDWLVAQFAGRDDAIIVNDGGQYGPCVPQPIMTYSCVLRMNRAVIHPSYQHFCADSELYTNLSEMGALRDLRASPTVFEHRNWAWLKRAKDEHDEYNIGVWARDAENLHARLQMPLSERLKVDEAAVDAMFRGVG